MIRYARETDRIDAFNRSQVGSMNYYEIATFLLGEFPDETVQTGQRLRKSQVEIINMLVMEIKKLWELGEPQ